MTEITLKLTEEEQILLAGILAYSDGDILTNVFDKLTETLNHDQRQKIRKIVREIAIKANGYYIDEEELLYEIFRK